MVGNFDERKKLNSQGTRGANFGITKNCQHLGTRKLSHEDKKQLKNIYPGFCYSLLDRWIRRVNPTALDDRERKDIKLMHEMEYGFIPIPRSAIIGFSISNPTYKKWFKRSFTIFDEPTTVDIPEPISQYEKLFDKNVLPIKKLVKDIGSLDNLTIEII